jgi:hypothetical protein
MNAACFLLVLYLELTMIWAFRIPTPLSAVRMRWTGMKDQVVRKTWYNEEAQEYVIELEPQPSLGGEHSTLFDSLYSGRDSSGGGSIAGLTLREISSCYMFSLNYLGDLVAQMGCSVPVDVDVKVGDMLTSEQVYTLLQAVNTLDPHETNAGYGEVTLQYLIDELEVPIHKARMVCEREGIQLPFGLSTVLHSTVVEQFKRSVSHKPYVT